MGFGLHSRTHWNLRQLVPASEKAGQRVTVIGSSIGKAVIGEEHGSIVSIHFFITLKSVISRTGAQAVPLLIGKTGIDSTHTNNTRPIKFSIQKGQAIHTRIPDSLFSAPEIG